MQIHWYRIMDKLCLSLSKASIPSILFPYPILFAMVSKEYLVLFMYESSNFSILTTLPCQISHFTFLTHTYSYCCVVWCLIRASLVQSNWLCLRYLSPCLVVVQVHQPAGVFLNLTGVYKAPWELHAVLNVSWAASPLPSLLLVVMVALLLAVAATLAEVALATSCGHCVGNSSCGDGISECCLPAP